MSTCEASMFYHECSISARFQGDERFMSIFKDSKENKHKPTEPRMEKISNHIRSTEVIGMSDGRRRLGGTSVLKQFPKMQYLNIYKNME